MNSLGREAMTHWRRWLPSRYAQIPIEERDGYFTGLGDLAQARLEDLTATLTAQQVTSSTSPDQARGLEQMARLRAMEIVRAEILLPEPEETYDPDLDGPPYPLAKWQDPQGMPWDREHRIWQMLEDDNVSPQEFQAATAAWDKELWARLEAGQDGPEGTSTR